MKPTLLVLAAGLGTRYGGLKQIDPVGPHGQTLIDYSIYDAIEAGFGRVVFVIRHCFEQAFKDVVSSKFDRFVQTDYVYQELETGLGDFATPADREKPWGTGHAVLISQDVIREPFAVVNADDYYGAGSLKTIAAFLSTDATPDRYAMIGYILSNTLSEYGAVARGITECDEHMFLRRVTERKGIQRTAAGIRYLDVDGTAHTLIGDEIVSMNLWGFHPSIFTHLAVEFRRFLQERGREKSSELYIPFVVDTLVTSGEARVSVHRTQDRWFGVTYRADAPAATRRIHELIAEGVYPERLWE
ncbi:MAG: sugar phosphate nucleotidyltransferase [Phycisphaerales bacterium]